MPKLYAVAPAKVAALARRDGFDLSGDATETLAVYLGLLMQWNRAMNLVGTSTWEETFRELVPDSLHLARFLETLELPDAPRCRDLGAGAGLPGIPLRAVWQKGEYLMVEAREKRALFLSTILARRPLPGTRVFRGRAESLPNGPSERADLILGKAFMPWPALLKLARDHLTPKGCVVLLLNRPLDPDLLEGWRCTGDYRYAVSGRDRAFAAVRPL